MNRVARFRGLVFTILALGVTLAVIAPVFMNFATPWSSSAWQVDARRVS